MGDRERGQNDYSKDGELVDCWFKQKEAKLTKGEFLLLPTPLFPHVLQDERDVLLQADADGVAGAAG